MDKSHPDSHRSILESTFMLSLGTLVSRILGFVRDLILAKVFGTTPAADSFFVAFRLSNLWRDLTGEGATNSAVLPVLAEYVEPPPSKDQKALWPLVCVVFILFLITLSLITILGILAAPGIVRVIAPGFMADPEKLHLTIRLTRLIFPYLVLIGLTAYSMGVLYTLRSFWAPAFSPCLLNVAMILSALWASQTMEEPIVGLAVGVLAGGFLQLLVQLVTLRKLGMRWVWPKTLIPPAARKMGRLLVPRLLGSGIYQISLLIDTLCASLQTIVGTGGISAIYYANRIIQFPQGIFGVALASALLPSLSGFAVRHNRESLRKTLLFSLQNIFLIMFPASVACLVLSFPMIKVLFERGEFTSYSTHITASALLFYALGLWAYGGVKILTTTFHAMQDTKTPVKVGALCLFLNVVLNFLLMGPLKVGGIALASSIAVSTDFLILFYTMEKRLGALKEGMRSYVVRLGSASLGMGLLMQGSWASLEIMNEFMRLFVVGFIGFGAYILLCFLLRIESVVKGVQWISRKK